MAGLRQDYLLRHLELLRQFIARLTSDNRDRDWEEALLLSLHLQEKLLPLPPAEFLRLALPAQIEALRRNESAAHAQEKIFTYAALLAETAALYDLKGRDDLAAGARQMGLYAALCVVVEDRLHAPAAALVEKLAAAFDPADLHAPVTTLLAEYRATA